MMNKEKLISILNEEIRLSIEDARFYETHSFNSGNSQLRYCLAWEAGYRKALERVKEEFLNESNSATPNDDVTK